MAACQIAVAQDPAAGGALLRFGAIPVGGVADSHNEWVPVLKDLEHHLDRPLTMFSAGSYGALSRAIARGEIDIAFLPGKMALDAVIEHGMCVLTQVQRHDGVPGVRAVLLARTHGERSTLGQLLADPGGWRIARGEAQSLSGFIVPQLELFMPHGIDMETEFASELVATHSQVALAVANGEADVGATNTVEVERFGQRFTQEAAQLHVIWTSELMLSEVVVMQCGMDASLRQATAAFFSTYGDDPTRPEQRQRLGVLLGAARFVPADNHVLEPVVETVHAHQRARALAAEWVDEAARERRLARVDARAETWRQQLNTR